MKIQKMITVYEKEGGAKSHFLSILSEIERLRLSKNVQILRSIKTKDKKMQDLIRDALVKIETQNTKDKQVKMKKAKFKSLLDSVEFLLRKKEIVSAESKQLTRFMQEASQLRYMISADQELYNLDARYMKLASEYKKRGFK